MTQQGASSQQILSSPPPQDSNTDDSNLTAEHYLHQIDRLDNPPIKVVKSSTQNLVYHKDIHIRYLQPPTPPLPAPIIIREKQLPPKRPVSVRIEILTF